MNIRKVYSELVFISIVLNFFDSLLTAIVIMAISYLLIYFYRINYVFAIVVAAIFFIRSFIRKIRQNKILLLESKYPNLKERLRTSYDNQDEQNTVVSSLHNDIMKLLNNVDINAYLNIRKLVFKVFMICILMFSVLYFSSVGFDVLELKTRFVHSAIFQKLSSGVKNFIDKPVEMQDNNKLSEPRLLDLGNKNMNVTVEVYNTELDISEISEPEKNDYGGHFPDEVKGAAQEVYEEDIPEEYKDVIKDYFDKINK